MRYMLRTSIGAVIFALITSFSPVHSGEPPNFIQETFSEDGVDSAWANYQSIFLDSNTVLDGKTKELMALSVSAQVPCDYCIYYHTEAAKALGATDAEIRGALAVAALIRKRSTILNGVQYDEAQWRREVDAMFAGE